MFDPSQSRTINSAPKLLDHLYAQVKANPDVNFQVVEKLQYQTPRARMSYDFCRLSSNLDLRDHPVLLIRAGIHGNEPAGSLTLRDNIKEIFNYAHSRGVGLVIYPLDNPSGYTFNTRYNVEHVFGGAANNDFIRFVLENGQIVEDIGSGYIPGTKSKVPVRDAIWCTDLLALPKETLALHRDLKNLLHQGICPIAVLDLHQDLFIKKAATFQYIFGENTPYRKIIEEVSRIRDLDLLKSCEHQRHSDVVIGYETDRYLVCGNPEWEFKEVTDAFGCIEHHDGTLPDLFHSMFNTPYCVTTEVSGVTSKSQADQVHICWIKGLIDLSAEHRR